MWVRVTNTDNREIFLHREQMQFMRWDEGKSCTVIKMYGDESRLPNKDGGNLYQVKEKPEQILNGKLNVG